MTTLKKIATNHWRLLENKATVIGLSKELKIAHYIILAIGEAVNTADFDSAIRRFKSYIASHIG